MAFDSINSMYANPERTIDGLKGAVSQLLMDYATRHMCSATCVITVDGHEPIELTVTHHPENMPK